MGDALRRRLETLNRGALPSETLMSAARAAAVGTSPGKRPTSSTTPPNSITSAWRSGKAPQLAGLLRRGEAARNDVGEHWRIALAVEELWPGGNRLVARRHEALLAGLSPEPATEPHWIADFPERVAFLDLETCGLGGSAVFLAGLLRLIDGRLAVELILARDYSEESAMLASLWQRLEGVATIFTFNGKSFDWPMVMDRTRRHLLSRNATSAPARHIDLLHLSRRRWRGQLPDCRLQTLERHICGRTRTDDVPGHMIPAAYQEYVRTGFEREMDAILLHNAIDLVTMLDLAMRLA
jgi:uncharacterized protein YprB with RNaseH-like and TPR domain